MQDAEGDSADSTNRSSCSREDANGSHHDGTDWIDGSCHDVQGTGFGIDCYYSSFRVAGRDKT